MTGADARLVEAQGLIDAQRYTDAVGLLRSHLERNPGDSDADYLLGVAAYGSNDDGLAVPAFERSVRADPDNEFAQFGLEMASRQQQRSKPAPTGPREPGPAPDKRPRLLALAVGLVLALTVAVVVVVLILLPGQKRFDPIQVGDSPDGVAVARGVVWVASRDGAVTRIQPDEPSTKRIGLGIGKNLDSVAIGGGSVWVTDEDQGKVARLDEDSGSVGEPITVGGRPKGLAVGGGAVWVANCQGRVIRIPLEPGSRLSRISVNGHPRSVAVARGRVYVAVRPAYPGCGSATRGAGKISSLDVSGKTKKLRRLLRIGDPSDIAFTKDWLWVADVSRNRVLRVDPDSGKIQGELRVNSLLTAVAADEDGVWALSRGPNPKTDPGTVTRIDPATGKRVGKPIAIGDNPQEIAVERGRVWVTQADTDKVTPIKP